MQERRANMRTEPIACGDASVWIFNVGDLYFDMADGLGVAEEEWRPLYAAYFEQPVAVPVQCILIQTAEGYVLVDAASSDLPDESPFRIPGYVPPPSLEAQLAAVGIQPEQIGAVVITHVHYDHYNGVTVDGNGDQIAAYPHARHYVGRADWEMLQAQGAINQPGTDEYQTLGWLARHDRLVLAEGEMDLGSGVTIVPTPGETPGHLAVKVASRGSSLYCIGDIYHHALEVEHPQWAVTWADRTAMGESRRWLVQQALAEDAMLIASHMVGAGKLAPTSSGVRWVAIDPATYA